MTDEDLLAKVGDLPSETVQESMLEFDALTRQHAREERLKDALSNVQLVAIYLIPALFVLFGVVAILYWFIIGEVDKAADWIMIVGSGVLGLLFGSAKNLLDD